MKGVLAAAHDCLRRDESFAFATIVEIRRHDLANGTALGAKLLVTLNGPPIGSLGSVSLDTAVERDLRKALATSQRATWRCGADGESEGDELTLFVDVFPRRPRMIIFGAVDFTRALVKVAKALNYHVTVCDARRTFATIARFPEADHVVVDWPDRYLHALTPPLEPADAVCVLTHDQKFDVPALTEALRTQAGYIGAMGSHRTNAERRKRLLSSGISSDQIEHIMAPIGVDIGARSPEETAISICAEIIALRSGTPVASLRDSMGPIHRVGPNGRNSPYPC